MPMMVCIPCKTLFKIEKNSIDAVYTIDGAVYQVYSSDKWKCPSCGIEILAGFGKGPFIEGYQLKAEEDGKLKRYLEESKAEGRSVEFSDYPFWKEIRTALGTSDGNDS